MITRVCGLAVKSGDSPAEDMCGCFYFHCQLVAVLTSLLFLPDDRWALPYPTDSMSYCIVIVM